MFQKRLLCLMTALACLCAAALPGAAAEVDSDAVYCFSGEDFSASTDPLMGVCITGLPTAESGTGT